MSSTMCFAASAAAASLSVDTVVIGTSDSTPESNATTGMPRDWASAMSGIDASESSAAKPMASGFLSSAVCSMESCLSTSVSVSGPSNVTSTPSSSAASSAPCFTACQNWCWKPLETSATYGVPPSPPPGADPSSAAELHAPSARRRATAPAAPTCFRRAARVVFMRVLLRGMTSSSGRRGRYGRVEGGRAPGSGVLATPEDVGVDGEEDDDADGDLLPLLRDRHDPQAVGERGHDERADHGPEDRGLAAAQGRAADDDGGDRLELVPEPEAGLGRVEPRRHDDAREPGEDARDRVDHDLPAPHVDAGDRRRLLVGADGQRVPADERLAEQHARDDGGDEEDEDGVRQPGHELAERDLAEARDVGEVDGLGAGDDERQALRDHHGRERRDERRDAEERHVEAVDEPEQRPGRDPAEHAHRERETEVGEEHARHDGAQRHPGPDRQVDPARGDDERRAERHDPGDRGGEQDALDVRPVEEVRARDREEREDHHEAGEREDLLELLAVARAARRHDGVGQGVGDGGGRGHRASPVVARRCSAPPKRVASSMTLCGVASALSRTPVTRPSHMTTIRSDRRRTSGSSDEIMTIALPWSASVRRRSWISSFAPTSMPRVGSSTTSTSQSRTSHLASTTFCWLPPERFFVRWRTDGVLMARRRTMSVATRRASPSRTNPARLSRPSEDSMTFAV